MFMKLHDFILLSPLDSNYWRLGSTSHLLSSSWMTPSQDLLIPWISGMMISIMTLGKLCSGAKTLGWEHSNGYLKMILKTLEWSAIPLMDFKKI
jgi:hypothetical protein